MRKFRWNMNEEEFKRLQKALGSEETESDDVYGQVAVGDMCYDIMTQDRAAFDENIPAGVGNVLSGYAFVAGIDDGYGELEDGIPYALVDDVLDSRTIKTDGTFDEFKASVEKMLENGANPDMWKLCNYSDFEERAAKWTAWLDSEKEPKWFD